jgi:hypothetical protein
MISICYGIEYGFRCAVCLRGEEKTSILWKPAILLKSGVPELCTNADPENSSSITLSILDLSCRNNIIAANTSQLLGIIKATKAHQSYLGPNRNIDRKSLLRICPCLPVLSC